MASSSETTGISTVESSSPYSLVSSLSSSWLKRTGWMRFGSGNEPDMSPGICIIRGGGGGGRTPFLNRANKSGDGGDDGDENDDDNNDGNTTTPSTSSKISTSTYNNTAILSIPNILSSFFIRDTFRFALTTVSILYVLNQAHVLPPRLSSVVSKVLFWPTLPITASRRIGKWVTPVPTSLDWHDNNSDDYNVIIGGVPISILNMPQVLHRDYGVRGVINMCKEYRGPIKAYHKLGIEQLHLPTIDHTEPSLQDMKKACAFIKDYASKGKGNVYVHCKAGHGRSAAIVFAWLISNYDDPENIDLKQLNDNLVQVRDVRSELWKQPNVNSFREWLALGKTSRK